MTPAMCACCGERVPGFWSDIRKRRTFCRRCFEDPALWFPTKERLLATTNGHFLMENDLHQPPPKEMKEGRLRATK